MTAPRSWDEVNGTKHLRPDRDLIRLHNLRKRLWDRIKGGAEDPELAALILAMNEVTDRVIEMGKG